MESEYIWGIKLKLRHFLSVDVTDLTQTHLFERLLYPPENHDGFSSASSCFAKKLISLLLYECVKRWNKNIVGQSVRPEWQDEDKNNFRSSPGPHSGSVDDSVYYFSREKTGEDKCSLCLRSAVFYVLGSRLGVHLTVWDPFCHCFVCRIWALMPGSLENDRATDLDALAKQL